MGRAHAIFVCYTAWQWITSIVVWCSYTMSLQLTSAVAGKQHQPHRKRNVKKHTRKLNRTQKNVVSRDYKNIKSVLVPSAFYPALVGLLYDHTHALVMLSVVSDNKRTTAWNVHITTKFSYVDTVYIMKTLCNAGYLTQVFNPAAYSYTAVSIYECASCVLLTDTKMVDTVVSTRKNNSNVVIGSVDDIISWISARSHAASISISKT